MGRRCVVPNCKSGHRGYENEKITIFSVRKNDIAVWSEILGCNLNEKSCVCEKHFNPKDIKLKSITVKDGKIIFEMSFLQIYLNIFFLKTVMNTYSVSSI